tara:strand:- start:448 stop:618 length:171 start_codon:yes stop_codon:yes gene_type:complete
VFQQKVQIWKLPFYQQGNCKSQKKVQEETITNFSLIVDVKTNKQTTTKEQHTKQPE